MITTLSLTLSTLKKPAGKTTASSRKRGGRSKLKTNHSNYLTEEELQQNKQLFHSEVQRQIDANKEKLSFFYPFYVFERHGI